MIVCLSRVNHTFGVAVSAAFLAVHFLSTEDKELAQLFGRETGDVDDKFDQCQWDEGPGGTPVLRGCRGWIAGPILGRFDAGDHQAVVIAPEVGQVRPRAANQLGIRTLGRLKPGHPAG